MPPTTSRTGVLMTTVAALIALAPPHAAATQDARPRHGLWIALGFGAGRVEHRSDQASPSRRTTGTASLRGGFTIVPALRLGFEANGWGLESVNTSNPSKGVTVNETLVIAQMYPWPARSFHLKAGIGWGSFHTMHADDWGSTAYGATVLGVGYDVRVARDLFHTLGADWARGPLGDANPLVTTSTHRRFRAWSVHGGIQYH